MQALKKIWLFKNRTNFMIFFTGVTSTGYFLARQVNERRFEHPIIDEATRLLHKNSQIVELVGTIFQKKTLFLYYFK